MHHLDNHVIHVPGVPLQLDRTASGDRGDLSTRLAGLQDVSFGPNE
jgi:hypothetical protein